jgi:hypothetical protein
LTATVTPIRRSARRPRTLAPFTVSHFRVYASRLVFDDGLRREPEEWQLDFAREVFRGLAAGGSRGLAGAGRRARARVAEAWLLVPEGNGKTTFVGELALYGADWAPRPWIPVAASSRDQAKTLYTQTKGFVDDTPGMRRRFVCFDGYRSIVPLNPRTGKKRPGRGIEIMPWDPDSNDGVIPFPYYILDELHRHPDMSLSRLWKGKARKRMAVGIGISTAGYPGDEFEQARDKMRHQATQQSRGHAGATIYRGTGYVLVEFRLADPTKAEDARAVKRVNPLSSVTVEALQEELDSPTFDIGHWKRVKCNIAARSILAAITDEEWLRAVHPEYAEIPEGEHCDAGLDLGWKHDTTALTAQWRTPETIKVGAVDVPVHLWDEAKIIVPPRDGSSTHPDRVKAALTARHERNPIDTLVMDTTDGEDIAAWAADELGCTVIDRPQGNTLAVKDYKNVMRGLRTGLLRRVRNAPGLTQHSMNAIAWRLPGGDTKFERPNPSRSKAKQDLRVIDALVAGGFVYTHVCIDIPDEPIDLDAYRIRQL